MIGPLVQMMTLITLTHGFRALGKWVGPLRSGLLMGFPSTTALVLVGCALERGLDEATVAAEACLVGLVAAAMLPLAYARAASAGWRWPAATGAAAIGYVAVAAGLWWIPKPGAVGCVALSATGLVVTCHLARKTRTVDPMITTMRRPLSVVSLFAYRTAIPTAYFLMLRVLRVVVGAGFASRFITFPGGSLAVLVTTHLEAGPGHACRMASAMPTGGLGMLAFLTVFRFGCPRLGLRLWGTLVSLPPRSGLSPRSGRFRDTTTSEGRTAYFPRFRAERPGFIRRTVTKATIEHRAGNVLQKPEPSLARSMLASGDKPGFPRGSRPWWTDPLARNERGPESLNSGPLSTIKPVWI